MSSKQPPFCFLSLSLYIYMTIRYKTLQKKRRYSHKHFSLEYFLISVL